MNPLQTTPECEFETVTADDILDGLATLQGKSGEGVILPPPGEGPDTFLSWAIQEIMNSKRTASHDESSQLRTNAVLNARRGLACLVDWYVERDLAKYCRDAPVTPKQQAAFLVSRGIIDELTSSVLERAIAKRNVVEHQYTVPDLATAEDVVELLRRTIAAVRIQSDPASGPWIFGIVFASWGSGPDGPWAKFRGWSDPLVVFSRFAPRPWVGLVLPEYKDSARANIRRAFLDSISTAQLVEMLSIAERTFGHPPGSASPNLCQTLARALGFMPD